MENGDESKLHRIKSDEMWHFYDGGVLEITVQTPDGKNHIEYLSQENPQLWIPAGYWFGSKPSPDSSFVFCGCTVSPGFDFQDFELL